MLRAHEAAPPGPPGAAESLVSFIPLFGGPPRLPGRYVVDGFLLKNDRSARMTSS